MGASPKSDVLETTVGGGFAVPRRTSYVVAPDAFQLRFGVTVTATVPSGGFDEFGAAGAPVDGGEAAVNCIQSMLPTALLPPRP